MNNENTSNVVAAPQKTAGRPRITILWPDGEFTVESLHTLTGISKVTIYERVEEDLKSQVIEECGKQKSNGGRPRRVYKKKPVVSLFSGSATSSSPVVV